ncbi:hypothetical protein AQUCO_01400276v1 [Aquilegia coerulea]|uniref:TF-B3 domain-containing protein n=1 Tax=Aquilegia coerulea TaxID=218851 RepID=A0A2G5DVJ8_AQUCA|nr:hypothetical protein AQUCO_01400276v1 [Aquilegia coerulea]
MAKTTSRPRNPHFFKFIMPAAFEGISIPKAFMKDHLEGERCEGRKTMLRTTKSCKPWVIHTKGCCFTDGWEDFAREHDLRVGDLLLFRHEGGFNFNVIVFDATMCERVYQPLDGDTIDDDDHILMEKKKEQNDGIAKGYPIKHYIFCRFKGNKSKHNMYAKIFTTRWCLCVQLVPANFRRKYGLNKPCMIMLKDPEGEYWEVGLRHKRDCQAYIGRGWSTFLYANRMKVGDVCTLNKMVSKDFKKIVMEVSISRCRS